MHMSCLLLLPVEAAGWAHTCQPVARKAHGRAAELSRNSLDSMCSHFVPPHPICSISKRHMPRLLFYARVNPNFGPAPCRLSRQGLRVAVRKRKRPCVWSWAPFQARELCVGQPRGPFLSPQHARSFTRRMSQVPANLYAFFGGVCPSIRQCCCWLFVTHNMQQRKPSSSTAGHPSLLLHSYGTLKDCKSFSGASATCGNRVISLFRSNHSSRLSSHSITSSLFYNGLLAIDREGPGPRHHP